ncbi:MAPEG family protein [Marinobacter sp. SS21]|uniref:MAPEG family protein n=1 Tax=Marinobacter sp. SS21 TaxID=2979460 RepID=UPI00232DFFE2|nr:MAPEG family protein [Marinobacter sp. SS21]MDC0662951.1 MAPEG family protein [Marinobacter sp. SS21]
MILPVTAVYASVCAILLIILSYRVTSFRRRYKQGLGVNEDRDFEAAVRTQANFTEYAPMALILLALGELNGVAVGWIHGLGLMFVLGRILHAWGMVQGRGGAHMGRFYGTILSWLALLSLAVAVLLNVVLSNV